ncbi:PilZ domain-containing protein [Nitrospira sp. NS4]|uniref:PilZ domain-containing protein n=1 Tax=Nitrospira sp. NS4 TaxID=3414498 RepID=UPI003C2E995D
MEQTQEQTKPYQRAHYRLPLPVSYPVMFAGADAIGEGTVTNLTVLGCTIECATPPSQAGNLLLRLILPDRPESLPIDGAEVRWVKDNQIGVQFTNVERAANLRLHGFVWDRMIERLTTMKQQKSSPSQS